MDINCIICTYSRFCFIPVYRKKAENKTELNNHKKTKKASFQSFVFMIKKRKNLITNILTFQFYRII